MPGTQIFSQLSSSVDGTKDSSWDTEAIIFPYQEEHANKGDGEADSEVLVFLPGAHQEGRLLRDMK